MSLSMLRTLNEVAACCRSHNPHLTDAQQIAWYTTVINTLLMDFESPIVSADATIHIRMTLFFDPIKTAPIHGELHSISGVDIPLSLLKFISDESNFQVLLYKISRMPWPRTKPSRLYDATFTFSQGSNEASWYINHVECMDEVFEDEVLCPSCGGDYFVNQVIGKDGLLKCKCQDEE